MSHTALQPSEYHPFYLPYIQKVNENISVIQALKDSHNAFLEIISPLSDDALNMRYAPGKWTIKEIIGHLCDSERIFANRILRFARFDKTDLPGFDEDLFAANSNAATRTKDSLLAEFSTVRGGSILLFQSFQETWYTNIGTIGGNNMSVRALGYIMSGHQLYHLEVIKSRYLK
ncbi:MAG: DinB family protein [Flavobacteriaceae bacterium]|nr:DinB family protein [Flavobacteriaceae bacterium]